MDVVYRSPCSSPLWPRGATAKQPIALGDLTLVIVGRGITQNSMPTKTASRTAPSTASSRHPIDNMPVAIARQVGPESPSLP